MKGNGGTLGDENKQLLTIVALVQIYQKFLEAAGAKGEKKDRKKIIPECAERIQGILLSLLG